MAEHKKDRRFTAGVAATILWLAFMGVMLCRYGMPGKLENWADFFAGFFSPIAFLWLVIGYLQQGEELRNSAEALNLQAEELRNSVEQQIKLVEISREQLQREREALEDEREARREAAQPKFILRHTGTSSGSFGIVYNLQLVNVGNTATSILVSYSPPVQGSPDHMLDLIGRGQSEAIGLACQGDFQTTVRFSYMDADALPGAVEVQLQGFESGQLIMGQLTRVT